MKRNEIEPFIGHVMKIDCTIFSDLPRIIITPLLSVDDVVIHHGHPYDLTEKTISCGGGTKYLSDIQSISKPTSEELCRWFECYVKFHNDVIKTDRVENGGSGEDWCELKFDDIVVHR